MPREVTYVVGQAGGPQREVTVKVHDLDVDPWGADAKLRVVGTDVPRLDAPDKATGVAKYTYDIVRPRMAFSRLVRCYHSHAIVDDIDIGFATAT